MKVALFSLNCASKKNIPLFEDRDVFQHDPDCFVEMSQEDYRSRQSPSLFESVPTMYTLVAQTDLNGKETKQNLQIRLYTKTSRSLALQEGLEVGRIQLPPKGTVGKTLKNKAMLIGLRSAATVPYLPYGYTKGAVWIKIKEPMPILFVNMHLPMKKGQANLGFSLRVAALQKILLELKDKIDESTTVLIGGDLNFRIEPQDNGRGVNQLTRFLSSNDRFQSLKELPMKPEDRIFTCKFRKAASTRKKLAARLLRKELTEDPAANCNTLRAKVTASNNATLRNTAKNLQQKCGALDRFPSRCDRFLYGEATNVDVQVLQYKGYPFFPKSDHNAIYATLDLQYKSNFKRKPSMKNLVGTLPEVNADEGNVEEDEEEEEEENGQSNSASDPRSGASSPISLNLSPRSPSPNRFNQSPVNSFSQKNPMVRQNRTSFDPSPVRVLGKNLNARRG